MMNMHISYDLEADAVMVTFRDPQQPTKMRILDDLRFVHYDATDEVWGVEFIEVSRGMNLEGVPHADEISAALHTLIPAA
jgi:uncharacterized protein YuzE